MLNRLTMHKISGRKIGKGIRIAAIPNVGSIEISKGRKEGTYTVRHVQIVSDRDNVEERRQYFEELNVEEKDLRTALEKAWAESVARSGKMPRTEVHVPSQPGGDTDHKRARRLGGTTK